jgi:hypothetical protein
MIGLINNFVSRQWIYNRLTITSNHYEVFLPFLIKSPWNADPPELDPIAQFYFSSPPSCRLLLYRLGSAPLENTCHVSEFVARNTYKTPLLLFFIATRHGPQQRTQTLYCCVTSPCIRKCFSCVA